MENNFLELCEIDSIEDGGYCNMVDIGVNGDASFILSNGIISHNSALSAVREFRDTQYIGAYPLKGKFVNVYELSDSKVIQKEEVKGLMGAIGLKLGEEPFTYLELSGNYVEVELSDGKVIKCDYNEELYINGEWIRVSDLVKKQSASVNK